MKTDNVSTKKKAVSLGLCLACATSCFGFVGCAGQKSNFNRASTIVISVFNGGYGYQYAKDVADDWNRENAETTGYSIIIDPNKDEWANGIRANFEAGVDSADLFVTTTDEVEAASVKGWIEDLSDVMNNPAENEEVSIASKILPNEKDDINSQILVKDKYFGMPLTSDMSGFIYDHDIFLEKGFLIADEKDKGKSRLIKNDTEKLSTGKDGVYGTLDDGQPIDMYEYELMLSAIKGSGMYTYLWTGKFLNYLTSPFVALEMSYDGHETFNQLLQCDATYVNPKTKESTVITMENGYEAYHTEGRLKAFQFIEKYLCDPTYYHVASAKSGTSHTDAQRIFVYGNAFNGTTADKQAAFLIEGVWWENEARANFNSLEKRGYNDYIYGSRNYRFMTLPNLDEDAVEKTSHCFCSNGSLYFLCAKQKDPDKLEAIKSYLRKFYTNENLRNTACNAGILVPFNCGLNEETMKTATQFFRNAYTLYSSDNVFVKRKEVLYTTPVSLMDDAVINGYGAGFAISAMMRGPGYNPKATAEQLFENSYEYRKKDWNK